MMLISPRSPCYLPLQRSLLSLSTPFCTGLHPYLLPLSAFFTNETEVSTVFIFVQGYTVWQADAIV